MNSHEAPLNEEIYAVHVDDAMHPVFRKGHLEESGYGRVFVLHRQDGSPRRSKDNLFVKRYMAEGMTFALTKEEAREEAKKLACAQVLAMAALYTREYGGHIHVL